MGELKLNHAAIGTSCGLDRDQVVNSLKAIVRAVGEIVRSGGKVILDFKVD